MEYTVINTKVDNITFSQKYTNSYYGSQIYDCDIKVLGRKTYYSEKQEVLNKVLENKNIINNIDNMKNIYFIKGTKFNRELFKSLHPDKKIKRDIKNAECVIYDDTIIESNNGSVYFAHLTENILFTDLGNIMRNNRTTRYNGQPTEPCLIEFIKNKNELKNSLTDIEFNALSLMKPIDYYSIARNVYLYTIKYEEIKNINLPLIHTSDVFNTKKNIDIDLSLEKINDIIAQVHSKDIDQRVLAYSSLYILPNAKYDNLQALFYFMSDPNSGQSLDSKSKIIKQYSMYLNSKLDLHFDEYKEVNKNFYDHSNRYRNLQYFINSWCTQNKKPNIIYNIIYAYYMVLKLNNTIFGGGSMELVDYAANKIIKEYTDVNMGADIFDVKFDILVAKIKNGPEKVDLPEVVVSDFDWNV